MIHSGTVDDPIEDGYSLYKNNQELLQKELWVKIPSELGLDKYLVSTTGHIWSKHVKRILKEQINNDGYKYLFIGSSNIRTINLVHILVLKTFIPYPADCDQKNYTVDHIDRNRSNNHILNLRWADPETQAKNKNFTKRKGKARAVLQLDLKGDLVKEWPSGQAAALGIGKLMKDKNRIYKACQEINGEAFGFLWRNKLELEPGETVKQIPGFPKFFATSKGRVMKYDGSIREGSLKGGYFVINLINEDGKSINSRVNRLICLTYHGAPSQEDMVANHINGIATDNRPENLEWITQSNNVKHAHDTGLIDMSEARIPVAQCNIKGEPIKEYESILAASKATGVPPGNISRAVRGIYKTSYGYIWKSLKKEKSQ